MTHTDGTHQYRFRVVARKSAERDPRYTYDEHGRREYASGLTLREARRLTDYRDLNGKGPDVIIEEHIGTFEGMPLWREAR